MNSYFPSPDHAIERGLARVDVSCNLLMNTKRRQKGIINVAELVSLTPAPGL
jgi:hypothetical protein